jgi:hypothetical protein
LDTGSSQLYVAISNTQYICVTQLHQADTRGIDQKGPKVPWIATRKNGTFGYAETLANKWEISRYRRAIRYGASVDSFSQVSSNSRSGSDPSMIPAPARNHVFPSHS